MVVRTCKIEIALSVEDAICITKDVENHANALD